jgi:branched-chain amino acid aminotransferase
MNVCAGSYFAENNYFRSCSSFSETLFEEGFSVYEVVRIVNGKCLFLGDHLKRLSRSVSLSGNVFEIDLESLTGIVRELIVRNNRNNGNIKIVVNFRTEGDKPFIFMFFIPHYYPSVNEYQNGVTVDLSKFVRNHPNIKKLVKRNNTPDEKGVYETLLVHENGYITEGNKSNVFFIRGDIVQTAPDNMVLQGITRQKVLGILQKLNIKLLPEPLHLSDLINVTCVFLTGTSPNVLPVHKVDQVEFNVQNDLLRNIMAEYNMLVNNYLCDTF